MSQTDSAAPSPKNENVLTPRKIVHRTHEHSHGPITRLMSPGDLGKALKPFVFLDIFEMNGAMVLPLHPHSGIATLTYLFEGSVWYEDSNGATGTLSAGGIEWFKAANGAWHAGGPEDTHTRGFQLWVALPSDQELGPVENIYQSPEEIKTVGPVRVLLGTYQGITSALKAPASMNYLAVQLKAGETWRYEPPVGHTVGWVALNSGQLQTVEKINAGELVIFESSNDAIDFHAEADTEFVLGSAVPHPHDLVMGNYSVHTSAATLKSGEQNIENVRKQLQRAGRL
ncbi:pirin family protein [Undibacterium sp. Di26W]|uniref:pirin family protein n=1 Tax=Undibacterium sp. Di26W TaxID=3413035 RepID=UPI003BF2B402